MTTSFSNFKIAISDAQDLIDCFDLLNGKSDTSAPEALKRASLVMTITAWETYIEDVATEIFMDKFSLIKGSHIGNYVEGQFTKNLKTFNNPDSLKVKNLFSDFLGFDVTDKWIWNNYITADQARCALNKWLKRRGEAVHRAQIDVKKPHLVKLDEIDQCIRFFTELAAITDKALSDA